MPGDENNGNKKCVLSLAKMAYLALTPDQLLAISMKYPFLNFDVLNCCKTLNYIIKMNSADGVFDPFGDRIYLYDKLIEKSKWTEMLRSAVQHGHMECLKIGHEFGCPLRLNEYDSIAIDMMSKVTHYIPKFTMDVCSVAAYYGQLECLKYARNHSVPWDVFTCFSAVIGNSFECLAYAVENGCNLNYLSVDVAACTGNLQIMKYLHEKGYEWSANVIGNAVVHGRMECLKYAHTNGCPWSPTTYEMAIGTRNLELFKYALDNGCPILSSEPIELAASMSQFLMIKYLCDRGTPLSVQACSNAAKGGDLKCLAYLLSCKCPWDETTIIAAIRGGNIKCLKFIAYQGNVTSTKPMEEAARLGNLDAMKFLYKHKWPWSTKTCLLAGVNRLRSLKFKHMKHKYENTTALYKNQGRCLMYAWKNGCPWPDGTCSAGKGNGRMDCLRSEPDHECMWDSERFGGQAAVIRNRKLNGRLKGPITQALLEPLLLKVIEGCKIPLFDSA